MNNPDKYKFMIQFSSSPYHTEAKEDIIRNFGKNMIKLIKDGIKNEILKDLPPKYILDFLSAHFIFTIEYIIQTKTKERKIFFDTLFNGIKY